MGITSLLKKIANILNTLKIPYIVTGGIAVVIWGRLRFTADIDIVVELIPQKVKRLVQALKAIRNGFIDQDTVESAVSRHDDAFDKERIKRRIVKSMEGQDIYFASPEDAILKKLLWYEESQSTRHLEDVASIIRMQKKLDIDYMKRWAKRHGTLALLLKLVKSSQQ